MWPLLVQRAPGAADCPDAVALSNLVEKLTKKRVFVPASPTTSGTTFEVQILKSEDALTAIILAAGRTRQIEDPGPGCDGLSSALALTLAILVDEDEQPSVIAPPVPAPVLPRSLPPPLPMATQRPPLPAVTPEAPRLLVVPLLGLSEGLSGSLVPAFSATAQVRFWKAFSLIAAFTWMPGQSIPIGSGRVSVQLLHGSLGPCWSTWRFSNRLQLGGCFEVHAGALHGQAFGFAQNREAFRPWTSFGPLGLVEVLVVGPLVVSARLGLHIVVPQERFQIDGVGVAFDPPPIGAFGAFGVGAKIF